MSSIKVACQTYSWQMSLETYRGRIGHIAAVAKNAGFSAIEPEMVMLGSAPSSEAVAAELAPHGIRVPALVLAEEWADAVESDEERRRGDRAFQLARDLGATRIVVVQASRDRRHLSERQRKLMDCFAGIAERARGFGLSVSFHPNSLESSLFRTSDDYELLSSILPADVGLAPDLGHVARGGMDVLEVVREFGGRVDHMHVKDMYSDGTWAPTGDGVVNIVGVMRHLEEIGFDGWVSFEDESDLARVDPDAATLAAGRWVRDHLGDLVVI